MKLYFWVFLMLCCLHQPVYAQANQLLTGTLDADHPTVQFSTRLRAGDVLVAVSRSDVDVVLALETSNGDRIAANGSISTNPHTTTLAVRIPQDDRYTISVTGRNMERQSGNFEVQLSVGDDSLLPPFEALARVTFSGPEQIHDTPHFRVHFTDTGNDAASAELVNEVATSLEQTWTIVIEELGWSPPLPDVLGGDERYDVYLATLPGPDSFSLGRTRPDMIVSDNPHTTAVETFAGPSFIVIDNDFSTSDDDWPDLLHMTIAHEFTHALEMGYDVSDWHGWYYEATATWMEATVFAPHKSTLEYAATGLHYPELCLGTRVERDGIGMDYATWPLMQALVDQYEPAIIRQLWESIAIHEGFDGLIQMLATYNQPFSDFVLRYHALRLARDITFMDQLDATVKISQSIDASGSFESVGDGVQELGVNYLTFSAPPATYSIQLDQSELELWAIGIRDEQADVFALSQDGIIDTTGYDPMYLLVFNPQPAVDPAACQYQTYRLDIAEGIDEPATVAFILDAVNFLPPD